MTEPTWRKLLESHARACRGEVGTRMSQADLGGANLRSADLGGADLWGADLWGANLEGADLWGANLWGANLRSADLGGANLRGADLRSADLRSANLRSADLRGANLRSADLGGADLRGANLEGANLRSANIPRVVYIGPVGSRHDVLLLHIPDMTYRAGCWTGTREQLVARLDMVYPEGEHRAGYLAAIAALEAMAEARKSEVTR